MMKKNLFRSLILICFSVLMIIGIALNNKSIATEINYYENDVTAPFGRIEVEGVSKSNNIDYVESQDIKVNVYASDDKSTESEIEYFVSLSPIESTSKIEGWVNLAENPTCNLTLPDKINAHSIYVAFKDFNGNISIISTAINQEITYNLNGGTYNGSSNNLTGIDTIRKYGAPFVVTSRIPTKKGLLFKGWSSDPMANTESYKAGDIIPADFIIAGNTLYAVYVELPKLSDVVSIGDHVNYPVEYENQEGALITGWRVLSKDVDIDGKSQPGTVNLVSAGIPMTYYHSNDTRTSVENLAINFLDTTFGSNGDNEFRKNGFEEGKTLREIFKNKYTDKYAENTNVTYETYDGNTVTGTKNANDLKVRIMTKEDLDKVYKSTTEKGTSLTSEKYNYLFVIPTTNNYASYYLAEGIDSSALWNVDTDGKMNENNNIEDGIRVVVSLREDILAAGKDVTGAWDIESSISDITYNIEYKTESGKILETEEITKEYETTNEIIAKEFKGYKTPANQIIEWDSEEPKTITFEYEPITYNITIDLDGGTGEENKTYTIESGDITLEEPTKEGHTFTGWTTANETTPNKEIIIPTGSTGNKEYTANWSINSYTLTFNADGGTEVEAITQNYNTAITVPVVPTKLGHTFKAWVPEIPATMPATNQTHTATWSVNSYTITFETNGGSSIAPITQKYGTEVTAPANPSKEGYTFAGWSEEIPTTMPAENMTTEANWTPNTNTKYTVYHYFENANDNGYSEYGNPVEKTGTTDSTITLANEKTAVTGGTYLKGSLTAGGSAVTETTIAPDGSTKIYLYYTRNKYTLTIEKDENVASVTGANTYKYGATVSISAVLGETLGYTYTFAGWTTTDTVSIKDATSASTTLTMPNGNVTIKATATKTANSGIKYKVYNYLENIEDSNYTQYGEVIERTGTTNELLTLADEAIEITGGTYLKGKLTTTGDLVTTTTIKADGTTELHLYYERNEYTLTVEKDANIASVTGAGTYKYGKTVPITAVLSNIAGYTITFKGWETEDNVTIIDPTVINSSVIIPNGNVTVTATSNKTVNSYIISYTLNGGTNPSGAKTTYTIEDEVTLPTPTREGYNFIGWTGENITTPQMTVTIGKGSIGDRTYTANWEEAKAEVGDFINYGISYTDVYTGTNYSTLQGWRLLSKTENANGNYDIELISTGIPAYLYYYASEINNAPWSGDSEQRAEYAEKYYQSASVNNRNMKAAAGLMYNFENIVFTQSNDAPSIYNTGTYKAITGSQNTNIGLFKASNLSDKEIGVRSVMHKDITGNGGNNITVTDPTGADGLFILKNINSTGSGYYWLASPHTTGENNLYTVSYAGSLIEYAGKRGVRPVVSISNVELEKNGDYYDIVVPTRYTVTLNANGGSVSVSSVSNSELYANLPNATRSGYTFAGWYTDKTAGTKVTNGDKLATAGNHTLYAHWEEAFAVYSEDDNSLRFYKNVPPTKGSQYNGKTVTAVYTGFEETYYSQSEAPWQEYYDVITDIIVEDKISPKSTSYWFEYCMEATNIDLSNLDTSKVTDMSYMFNGCMKVTNLDLSNFDTTLVNNLSGMFWNCYELSSINLSSFDTQNVKNMATMFCWCQSLETINVSNFNTSKVTDMSDMFAGCTKLKTIDISNFKVENVIYMQGLFSCCSSITKINFNGWNTSSLEETYEMFFDCSSITSLDLSGFNTSNVTNMSKMFNGCTKLQQITLGVNFKWVGTDGYLPAQTSSNISGANGKWYNIATNVGYAPADVPSNTAATYSAIPIYEVRFEANGGNIDDLGSTYTTRFVTYGKTYGETTAEFPTAVRDGYEFLGWFTSATDGTEIKSTTTVDTTASGLTLYAQWEKVVTWNAPKLGTELTPVNWNGSTWVATSEDNWEYNYDIATAGHNTVKGDGTGMWANAKTSDGSMYVWIPRFTYKITSGYHSDGNSWSNTTNSGTNKIEIIFSNGTDDTNGTSQGYLSHPAFTFGSELEGFWIAKYEASRSDATASSEGNTTTPASKPGVKSWTNTDITDMYTYAYNLNRTADSHLLKNVEWAAVAYLTNAIGKMPYINNSAFDTNIENPTCSITGNAGNTQDATVVVGVANAWNTAKGVKASTTHNVYGVYDMNGGSWEYVSAIYVSNGKASSYQTNVYNNRKSKYVDLYTTTYSESIKGDAFYETSGGSGYNAWDSDTADYQEDGYFPDCFSRGGGYFGEAGSGMFNFDWFGGSAYGCFGFRVSLVVL